MAIRTSSGRIISQAEAISTGQSGSIVPSRSRSGSSVQVTKRDEEGNVVDRFNIAPELVPELKAAEPTIAERDIQRVSVGPGQAAFFELEPEGPGSVSPVLTRDVSRVGREQFQETDFELSPESVESVRRASTSRGRVQTTLGIDRTDQEVEAVRSIETPSRDVRTFTPEGVVRPATRAEARATRRGRFLEEFVGDPLGAFFSPFSDVGGVLVGGRTQTTGPIIQTGTPLEQIGAVGGTLALIAAPRGLAALSRAEAALLSQVPRGLPRIGAGLGLATLEAQGVSRAAEFGLRRTAPEEFRPFLNQDVVFRTARQAEQAAESSFVRSSLGAINPALNPRNIDVFRDFAREQLVAQGFTGPELETALQAQMFRRTSVEPSRALAGTLQAGRFAEVFGRVNLQGLPAGFAERSFGGRALVTASRIAPAGVMEVRGELAGERAVQGSGLPFVDRQAPLRSLLPEVTLRDGFSIQPRSRLGEDIFSGAFGAATAGFLGGLVGAGATARRVGGGASRGLGNVANIVGNIADVSEPFTDILAGPSTGFVRSPGVLSFSNIGFAPAPVAAPSISGRTSRALDVGGFVPGTIPSIVPSTELTRGFASLVPSGVPVQPAPVVPSFVTVPSVVPVQPQIPSRVPAIIPPSPFVPVPATAFNARFPPPVPFDLSLAGSGIGRPTRTRTARVDELKIFTGFFSTRPQPGTRGAAVAKIRKAELTKRRKTRRSSNSFPNPFADLENLLGGGLF